MKQPYWHRAGASAYCGHISSFSIISLYENTVNSCCHSDVGVGAHFKVSNKVLQCQASCPVCG